MQRIDLHERRDPEMPVYEISDLTSLLVETKDNAWHEISNDDKVANRYTEALNRNGSVEYYRRIWIGDL